MRKIMIAALASTALAMPAAAENHPQTVRVMNAKGEGPFVINIDDYNADQSESNKNPKWTLAPNEVSPEGNTNSGLAATVVPDPALVIPPAPSAPNLDNPVAPSTVAPNEMLVDMVGKGAKAKFVVVYPDRSPVKNVLGIDEDGYATDQLAWEAVLKVKQNIRPATPLDNMPTAEDMQAAQDAAKNDG